MFDLVHFSNSLTGQRALPIWDVLICEWYFAAGVSIVQTSQFDFIILVIYLIRSLVSEMALRKGW